MAVNKVTYNGDTLIDLTGDTVTPDKLANGVTAHDKSGNAIVGTMSANCKSYEITLAKSSGWVLLATLDDEVLAHINDPDLIVSLKMISDYAFVSYSGNTYIAGNTIIGNYSASVPAYGLSNRTGSATSISAHAIYYPANKSDTSTSLGGSGMFRIDGNKYYLRPGDGYVYAGTYRLTFTW